MPRVSGKMNRGSELRSDSGELHSAASRMCSAKGAGVGGTGMNRWSRRLAMLCLLLTAFVAWLVPELRTAVVGWIRGEAQYQGRYTSYWRLQAQTWEPIGVYGWGEPRLQIFWA